MISWLSLYFLFSSILGIALILVLRLGKDRRASFLLLSFIIIFVLTPLITLKLPFLDDKPRGGEAGEGEIWFLLTLYIFLLLGMLANHAYSRLSQPQAKRRAFDLGLFLAPIFTSPIVIIPLFASVQAAGVDLYQADSARLMLFLVAFENGFFWKVIFDQRRAITNGKDKK